MDLTTFYHVRAAGESMLASNPRFGGPTVGHGAPADVAFWKSAIRYGKTTAAGQ
jgi:hypothetical protein